MCEQRCEVFVKIQNFFFFFFFLGGGGGEGVTGGCEQRIEVFVNIQKTSKFREFMSPAKDFFFLKYGII